MEFARGETVLACRDFGGAGPLVLCLHGLAGQAGEWVSVAQALTPSYRVLALDQRGHGRSDRQPGDVSREAFVADVATVIEKLGLGPVVLVGQSMGANTALLVAAEHPDLVSSLVVLEGSPDGPQPGENPPDTAAQIQQWLATWPAAFATENAAREFFASQGLEPDAWTAGLRQTADGLRPAFDRAVMVDCIAQLASRNYWRQWRSIHCPTLIVFGQRGYFNQKHGAQLVAQARSAELVIVPDAGHDLHLEAPARVSSLLLGFLGSTETAD
jgi:pimeloyl-ACP methyl ester carboxylesterase